MSFSSIIPGQTLHIPTNIAHKNKYMWNIVGKTTGSHSKNLEEEEQTQFENI